MILKHLTGRETWIAHMQRFARICDSAGRQLDDVMAVVHPAPNSYTGEDLVEISCHGNPLIVASILEAVRRTGLTRLALPGEFTRRAFLNGRIDLVQAEAVGAIIGAASSTGLEMAGKLLHGELSREIDLLRQALERIKTEVEATFILADREINPGSQQQEIEAILDQIRTVIQDGRRAGAVYSGINTTIAGRPNAGKSSLLNAILGYSRAIVHEDEGTTRDVISEHVVVGGMDFIFHDTAGIRAGAAGPEKIGIERTLEVLERSDLVLYVIDAVRGLDPEEQSWFGSGRKTIAVYNKIDLCGQPPAAIEGVPTVCISARHRQNIDGLLAAMQGLFPADLPRIFLDRHLELFSRAASALEAAIDALAQGLPPDIWVMDIDDAIGAIGTLTGRDVSADVLESVFSRFCVGK